MDNYVQQSLVSRCLGNKSTFHCIKSAVVAIFFVFIYSHCKSDTEIHHQHSQEKISGEVEGQFLSNADALNLNKLKNQALDIWSDSLSQERLGLLEAMLYDHRAFPGIDNPAGRYVSYVSGNVTYVVMKFKNPLSQPYGFSGQVLQNSLDRQVTINLTRIENIAQMMQYDSNQKKILIQAIWLQEVYEDRILRELALDNDVANALGELISLIHGTVDYLHFRLYTLGKPTFLLADLQGKNVITTLEQQSYNTSHKIYREAMIKHLKTTNMYDYFVNEQQVEDTKENNEDLIKKYFSDLEALLYHIVGS